MCDDVQVVRTDKSGGEQTLVSWERAREVICNAYPHDGAGENGVMRQLAFGHPVNTMFATYQHQDFVSGFERTAGKMFVRRWHEGGEETLHTLEEVMEEAVLPALRELDSEADGWVETFEAALKAGKPISTNAAIYQHRNWIKGWELKAFELGWPDYTQADFVATRVEMTTDQLCHQLKIDGDYFTGDTVGALVYGHAVYIELLSRYEFVHDLVPNAHNANYIGLMMGNEHWIEPFTAENLAKLEAELYRQSIREGMGLVISIDEREFVDGSVVPEPAGERR